MHFPKTRLLTHQHRCNDGRDYMCAISGTSGSSGLGSVSKEQIDKSTCTSAQEGQVEKTEEGLHKQTHCDTGFPSRTSQFIGENRDKEFSTVPHDWMQDQTRHIEPPRITAPAFEHRRTIPISQSNVSNVLTRGTHWPKSCQKDTFLLSRQENSPLILSEQGSTALSICPSICFHYC